MSRKFEDILDECLDRVIRQSEDLEQCLQDYPEIAEQLEPLLRTALTARTASASVQPRETFRSQSKERLLAQVRDAEQQPGRRRWHFPSMQWPQRWAVAVAAVLLVILIGGGGTVVASANAMPNDRLYPVKTFVEDVRMKFAGSDLDKAEYAAELADERMEEIAKMAEEGNQSGLERAANRLAKHLERIAKVAATQRAKGELEEEDVAELRDKLTAFATDHPLVLEEALQASSPAIQTAVRRVLDNAEGTYAKAVENVGIALSVRAAQPIPIVTTETVTGFIRAIAGEKWIVGQKVITVGADTVIDGIPKVGAGARVTATMRSDGTLLAQKIMVRTVTPSISEVAPENNTSLTPEANANALAVKNVRIRTFGGTITEINKAGLVIGTRSVIVNASTDIEGTPRIGQFARVRIVVRSDGSLLAQKIVVSSTRMLIPDGTQINDVPPIEPDTGTSVATPAEDSAQGISSAPLTTFKGEIQRMSPTEWIVSGRSVILDDKTVTEGTPRIGLMASIKGTVSADGFVLAQRIIVAEPTENSLSVGTANVNEVPPPTVQGPSISPDTSVLSPSLDAANSVDGSQKP